MIYGCLHNGQKPAEGSDQEAGGRITVHTWVWRSRGYRSLGFISLALTGLY